MPRKKTSSLIYFPHLLIPNATAFIAGFCIMVLELIASRIIARYLGASLYTWTSVIGVVLAGIALGNYIGGRLADRFQPRRTLSLLLILASVSCITVPILNHAIGDWQVLWYLSWMARIITHVTIIFLFPSVILGMIGPVVAKFALDQGFKTGRTVGNIYAWGAIGSILGTFISGFFLIAKLGTIAIIWTVAGLLAFIGVLYGVSCIFPYLWVGFLVILTFFALFPKGYAKVIGERLLLREKCNPRTIYEKESRYCHIEVEHSPESPEMEDLVLDTLVHSKVLMKDPTNIYYPHQYTYMKMYASLTRHFSGENKNLSFLAIGGGGYVLPRYLEKNYPGSHIEVVEIDPAVTETAIKVLGLSKESSIQIYHLDARNYIDDLIKQRQEAKVIPKFDFIYGDTFNDMSVPYQLTTYEFNERLSQLLSPDGIYMLHLIDTFYSGQFLGAILNTFQKTFPYIYVFSAGRLRITPYVRGTFVVVGSKRQLDFKDFPISKLEDSSLLNESQLKLVKERSHGIILTDDYAPVENLLGPVVRHYGIYLLSGKLTEFGNDAKRKGNPDKALKYYQKALRLNPYCVVAYVNIGNVLIQQKKPREAIQQCQKALQIDPDFVGAYFCLGKAFFKENRIKEAIQQYQKALQIDPDFAPAYLSLGNAFLKEGRVKEAIQQYQKALQIDPDFAAARHNLELLTK